MLTVKLNAKKISKNQQITPIEKICITFKKNKRTITSTIFYRELKKKPKPVN